MFFTLQPHTSARTPTAVTLRQYSLSALLKLGHQLSYSWLRGLTPRAHCCASLTTAARQDSPAASHLTRVAAFMNEARAGVALWLVYSTTLLLVGPPPRLCVITTSPLSSGKHSLFCTTTGSPVAGSRSKSSVQPRGTLRTSSASDSGSSISL